MNSLPAPRKTLIRSAHVVPLVEAAVVFAAAWGVERAFFGNGSTAFYWIPIVVLALQRGVPGGLLASVLVTAHYLYVTPLPQEFNQGYFATYVAWMKLPGLWCCGGLFLGLLRTRQALIERKKSQKLQQSQEDNLLLTDALESLRERSMALERQIAAEANTVASLLAMLPELAGEAPEDILANLTPYIAKQVNGSKVGIYSGEAGLFHRVGGFGPDTLEDANLALRSVEKNELVPGAFCAPIQSDNSNELHGLVLVHELEEGAEEALSSSCKGVAGYLDQCAKRPVISEAGTQLAG